jgi:uncharacterized membrane protein
MSAKSKQGPLKTDLKKVVKDLKEKPVKPVHNITNQTPLEETGKEFGKLSEGIFITIANKLHPSKKTKTTLGQNTADFMTKWAGSWTFIITFFIFLGAWMALNTYYWFQYMQGDPFDPFPFILLNLILSCLAAIQAPIILMSQNRQGQKDRLKAEYDYQVNRKAEKEIRELKTQLDRIERKLK